MADARLRTAEAELLGLHRVGDVEGWEIPGRYLGFLRGGPADRSPRSSATTTRTSARSAGCSPTSRRGSATPAARPTAPPGDLAGLARAFARERRLERSARLPRCGLRSTGPVGPARRPCRGARRRSVGRGAPHAGRARRAVVVAARPGRLRRAAAPAAIGRGSPRTAAFDAPWTTRADRRRTRPPAAPDRPPRRRRRRLDGAGGRPGRTAVVAAIEVAKIREHRLRDRPGALARRPWASTPIERRRRLGRPDRRSRRTSRRAVRAPAALGAAGARPQATRRPRPPLSSAVERPPDL